MAVVSGNPVAPVFVAQSKRPVCRAAEVVRHIVDRKASRRFPNADQRSARPHWVCRFDLLEVAQRSRPRRKPLRSPCPSQRSKTTPLDTF